MECKSNVRFVMSVLDNLDCYLLSALEDLIEDGELEQGSKEHGIALQVALRGYGSLSLQQQYLFNTKVVPLVDEYDEERYWDERAVSAPA
jgi:hypothetical protein